jgi:hypothetical protein
VLERLQHINTKWWWHESALIEAIGLEGTETATARDRGLGLVVSHAETTAPSASFACEEHKYGTKEVFSTTAGNEVKSQPRWFLFGEERPSNQRITMNQQSKLLASIQGAKSARLNEDATQRRQAGWRDWANEVWNEAGLSFKDKSFERFKQFLVIYLMIRRIIDLSPRK